MTVNRRTAAAIAMAAAVSSMSCSLWQRDVAPANGGEVREYQTNLDGMQALRMIRQINGDARVVMISSVGGVADKVAECLKAAPPHDLTTRLLEQQLGATLRG